LLAEAGYPDGEGFPTLQLWTHWRPYREATAQALADAWEENLGITTEVHLPDWGLYTDFMDECNRSKEALAACDMNVYIHAWVMDHGDPQNQLEILFAPNSGNQFTGWQSERYEELLDLARNEPETARRAEYYQEADKILCEEEAAIIPIKDWQRAVLVKEGVTFEYPPVYGSPAFEHWSLP
jgi:oligopeptide transport system substrate-binding protein